MNGYDIDGVLTAEVQPREPYVIISGRTFAEYDDVCKKLAQDAPVYIRGVGKYGDGVHAANFKAMMIIQLGVKMFFEDDDMQAQIIQHEVKGFCEVINLSKL